MDKQQIKTIDEFLRSNCQLTDEELYDILKINLECMEDGYGN